MSSVTRLSADEVAAAVLDLPLVPASVGRVIAACDDADMTVASSRR